MLPEKNTGGGVAVEHVASALDAQRDLLAARTGRRSTRWLIVGVGDAVAVLVAVVTALAATASLFTDQRASMGRIVLGVLSLCALWLLLFAAHGLYQRGRVRISDVSLTTGVKDVMPPLALGGLVVLLLQAPLVSVFGPGVVEPETIGVALGLALVLVPLARISMRCPAMLRYNPPERTIIVGSGAVAQMLSSKLNHHRRYGIDLVGFVDNEPGDGMDGCAYLGARQDLARVCEERGIERVLLAYSRAGHEEMLGLVRSVRNADIQISIIPRYFEIFPAHASLDDLEGIPVVTLPPVRLGRGARVVKRIFDVTVASVLILLLAPALLLIAAAVSIDSPGSPLFRQVRRGRNGSVFRILKFRTMRTDAEAQRFALGAQNEVDGPLFKLKSGDPRVTRVGEFLRRTSLDELPQLWNVVKNEMSMVGPRPFVVHEADQITGWASRRLDATPGLTGLWQSMGRNDLSYDEMKKLDYLYVTNWSLWWDVKILARTVRVVLTRHGAY